MGEKDATFPFIFPHYLLKCPVTLTGFGGETNLRKDKTKNKNKKNQKQTNKQKKKTKQTAWKLSNCNHPK